ncbi:MAG: CDP-diacylglycerol--glycerol-3-phosphate 3-phosphatidyltransferase [Oscillospiraceae bacterium]|jgi:CDP-diacylglycerol--glycerol-3-phosphate 3-phosphatidyltransferase|nr:CDP-diacylglycerol--glycerol-3-phosphate 3-phosphatidyltransferase [Oscillospiraceae bacterium]
MNTANKLTLFRVAMIPVLLVVLYWGFKYNSYVAAAIFVIASLTDWLDGHIARTRGQVTDFGKFMDPLADKVLVFAAMLWFTQQQIMPGWVTLIVLMREFAVTALRLIAVSNGRVIAAAWSGKVKTAVSMVCLTLLFVVGELPVEFHTWAKWSAVTLILVTTVFSGIEYFIKNKDVLNFRS